MTKTLWLEGAGCEGTQKNDVPNCRLRTVFVNDEGKWVYLEVMSADITKWNSRTPRKFGWKIGDHWCYVDSAFYVTDDPDVDDENDSRFDVDIHSGSNTDVDWGSVYPYTMDGILRLVNEGCNASFDEIRIADDSLVGYRAHRGTGNWRTRERFNRGDLFEYDERVHKAMLKKRAELKEYHKEVFGLRYDNTSYWNASDGTYTSPTMQVRLCVSDEKLKGVYESRKFAINVA